MIWAYFRNGKMAIAALVALGHDLVLTVGIYALIGFTVTPATLIGVLTILGYSLYDTVVVFDKVRENVRDIKSNCSSGPSRPRASLVRFLDREVVDTYVRGAGAVPRLLGAAVRRAQTGNVQTYLSALLAGTVVLAVAAVLVADGSRESAVIDISESVMQFLLAFIVVGPLLGAAAALLPAPPGLQGQEPRPGRAPPRRDRHRRRPHRRDRPGRSASTTTTRRRCRPRRTSAGSRRSTSASTSASTASRSPSWS